MGVTMGNGKWRAVPHHLCHVASTFYDSPHEEALCVTLDDSGECSTQEDMAGIPLVTPSRRRR